MAGIMNIVLSNPAPAVAQLFGDGTHPTTRLAQAALREVLALRRGARVLDVGTGTGILARVALEAGAGEVVGIDHHAVAVQTARSLVPGASFRVADAREYLTSHAGGAFDVVVANLPDPPLASLVPELVAAARLGGVLLVTGLLLWQADAVSRALRAEGASPSTPRAEAGWSLIVSSC
jgi:ribosomal protein L11 methyltransferase